MMIPTIAKDSKIIIVGSGVFGLSSALHLTKKGYTNVTVYDRLDLYAKNYDSELGADTASADINKVMRVQYGSKVHYHKLALRAKSVFEQWDKEIVDLEEPERSKFSRLKILENCGMLRLDNTEENTVDEIKNLETFSASGLRHTQFDINVPEDVERAKKEGWGAQLDPCNFKDNNPFEHLSGVLDSTSGMIYSANACLYVSIMLRKLGVNFVTGIEGSVKTLISEGADVKGITTQDGKDHFADLTILAAGPWTASLVPELEESSQAASGNIIMIKIPESRKDLREKYSAKNFPITLFRTGELREKEKYGGFSLFPATEPEGILKILTRQIKFSNPVNIDGKEISVPVTVNSNPPEYRLEKSLLDQFKDIIRLFAPDLVEYGIYKTQLLWYTNTVNNDFIVDFPPAMNDLLVVTGGSGHGFKFLPVLGEYVVDRIEGRTNTYTEIFKWRSPDDYEDINELKLSKLPKKMYYKQQLSSKDELSFSEKDLNRPIDVV